MSSFPTVLDSTDQALLHPDVATATRLRASRTDNQLVESVLAGDAHAFEEIFDRHKRLVAVIASRYYRQPDDIEEVIQIVFAKAFADLHKFRGDHDRSLASWLVRITSNACFDRLRGQKRRSEKLSCDLTESEAEAITRLTAIDSGLPEDELVERDLAEKLLSTLAPTDRALLEMLYVLEMSVADIAAELGWSRSNVKIRAWRARKAIRSLMMEIV